MRVVQINLQPHFGGGEVYTPFLCRALDRLGVGTLLFTHPDAAFWHDLDLPPSTQIRHARTAGEILDALSGGSEWLLSHGPLPPRILADRKPGWLLTAMAHMPLQGRNPRSFDGHDMVFPVSGWVRTGLVDAGVASWREPLYGVAELVRGKPSATPAPLHRRSRYDWDRRKFRDRALGWLEPLFEAVRPAETFARRTGLTLGIVSRLTPIKQFPQMFALLAPVLTCFPTVNLEIFGAGGYASVRDLDRALRPIRNRVRFWGHQADVRTVYASLDFLMAGLPEKEALGLNVIEAQACNLPVLAVHAPPFTETVADGLTGYFYDDPRRDGGNDFARLIERIVAGEPRLQPAAATEHLVRFSFDAFVERLEPVVSWAGKELES